MCVLSRKVSRKGAAKGYGDSRGAEMGTGKISPTAEAPKWGQAKYPPGKISPIEALLPAYQRAHPDRPPESATDFLPFATTPEQRAILEKQLQQEHKPAPTS